MIKKNTLEVTTYTSGQCTFYFRLFFFTNFLHDIATSASSAVVNKTGRATFSDSEISLLLFFCSSEKLLMVAELKKRNLVAPARRIR